MACSIGFLLFPGMPQMGFTGPYGVPAALRERNAGRQARRAQAVAEAASRLRGS